MQNSWAHLFIYHPFFCITVDHEIWPFWPPLVVPMDSPLTLPATSYLCIFWHVIVGFHQMPYQIMSLMSFPVINHKFFLFLVVFCPIWWFPWAPPSPFKCINGKIFSLNILVSIVGFLYSIESNFVYLTKHENSMNNAIFVLFCPLHFCSIWQASWATPQPFTYV